MDVGKLRDKAAAASAKGKHKKALEYYEKLSGLDSRDGMWPRKEGEMHRQLGNERAAIAAFERASERYAHMGFVVKAVAMCQMILRIDPEQVGAQEKLVAYNTERGFSVSPKAPVQDATPPNPVEIADAPLSELPLHKAAPGAKPRLESGVHSGITEIPIELELDLEAEVIEPVVDSAQEASEILRATPLFEHLPPDSLRQLISQVEFVELEAGEDLFRQGEEGTRLYVVVEGRVSILKNREDGEEITLGEMGEGDFLGEVGLVTQQPRSATVRGLVNSELLAISRRLILEMISDEPQVLRVLLRFLRERLVNNLMYTSLLFAPFLKQQRQELIRKFSFLEVEAETAIIKQGEHSPGLFVVLAGCLDVERVDGEERRHLATLHSGGIVGEMSLLANSEAVATVKTTTKSLLLELPKDVFRETIMTHPQVLAFIGDLASEREQMLAAVAEGEAEYEELHLDLF